MSSSSLRFMLHVAAMCLHTGFAGFEAYPTAHKLRVYANMFSSLRWFRFIISRTLREEKRDWNRKANRQWRRAWLALVTLYDCNLPYQWPVIIKSKNEKKTHVASHWVQKKNSRSELNDKTHSTSAPSTHIHWKPESEAGKKRKTIIRHKEIQ